MAKFWILAAFCLAAFVQLTLAQDVPEALSNGIRKLSKEASEENLPIVADITESSLKAETIDPVLAILEGVAPELNKPVTEQFAEGVTENAVSELNITVTDNLNENLPTENKDAETINPRQDTLEEVLENVTPELSKPVTEKFDENQTTDVKQATMDGIIENNVPELSKPVPEILDENQLNEDIKIAREFYQSLLDGAPEHREEVLKAIDILENILKESDLQKKQDDLLSLEKNFSPEFQTFLKEGSASWLDRNLKMIRGFLNYLLGRRNLRFKSEIAALKASADAALANDVPTDDKKRTLYKIFHPDNHELDLYLMELLPN